MNDDAPINDEPDIPAHEPRPHNNSGPASADSGPPPVDPSLLADYETQQAFREFLAERERTTAAAAPVAAVDIDRLVLEIPDGDTVHTFSTRDVSDEDVLSHLQVLITFSDTDMDRAGALFEALLGPDEYDRLRKTVRPMFRRIGAAHDADPVNNPSITDVWVQMARTISEPIRQMQSDPKGSGSQRGRSHTGQPSSIGSAPKSALPPSS